jgi:hypothetical protein
MKVIGELGIGYDPAMMELHFDADVPFSYPMYECPECKTRFCGGGRAYHVDCSCSGYNGIHCIFGNKVVQAVKLWAEEFGSDEEWYGISLNLLRERFPELL